MLSQVHIDVMPLSAEWYDCLIEEEEYSDVFDMK